MLNESKKRKKRCDANTESNLHAHVKETQEYSEPALTLPSELLSLVMNFIPTDESRTGMIVGATGGVNFFALSCSR